MPGAEPTRIGRQAVGVIRGSRNISRTFIALRAINRANRRPWLSSATESRYTYICSPELPLSNPPDEAPISQRRRGPYRAIDVVQTIASVELELGEFFTACGTNPPAKDRWLVYQSLHDGKARSSSRIPLTAATR